MPRLIGPLLLLVLAAAATGEEEDQAAGEPEHPWDEQKEQRMTLLFETVDKNADGLLNRHELVRFEGDRLIGEGVYETSLNDHARASQVFAEMDRDKDQRIDQNEFQAAEGTLARYHVADLDKDSFLSLEELQAFMYLHSPEQVKHRVGELMLEFDENKDDALSEPEIGDGLEAVCALLTCPALSSDGQDVPKSAPEVHEEL